MAPQPRPLLCTCRPSLCCPRRSHMPRSAGLLQTQICRKRGEDRHPHRPLPLPCALIALTVRMRAQAGRTTIIGGCWAMRCVYACFCIVVCGVWCVVWCVVCGVWCVVWCVCVCVCVGVRVRVCVRESARARVRECVCARVRVIVSALRSSVLATGPPSVYVLSLLSVSLSRSALPW